MLDRPHLRPALLWLPVALAAFFCANARAADKNEPWVEVRTAHFIVDSDGGERTAQRLADQFEQVRGAFQSAMPNAQLDTGLPIRILAARDGKSFALLLPEFPYDKRNIQPAGVFVSDEEETCIALRTNVSGPFPYEEVFQEYARLILNRSFHNLPPWLEEGYANALGGLTLDEHGIRVGRPDPEDLSVLWESPLLPLDLVLHADRNSPYYNPGDRETVYFAESRALAHYLLSEPNSPAENPLGRYLALVEGGTDSLAAARQAFGDLNLLQDKLEAYIKQTNSPGRDFQASGGAGSISSPRTLTAAELKARIGDFMLRRGQLDAARSRLEDALTQDPSLAGAQQSLGFVSLRQDRADEAEQHFARALELDPKDALAYYGRARALEKHAGSGEAPPGAIAALEKAVDLSPNFSPAWADLASLYAQRPETLEKALSAARRAVTLEPGNQGYQRMLSQIVADGQKGGIRTASAPSQNPSSDLDMSDRAGPLAGHNLGPPPPALSAERSVHLEHRTEPDEPPRTPATPATPETNTTPASSLGNRVYSMLGTITQAVCANVPQLLITLKAQAIVMRLHAADIARLVVKPASSLPSFCSSLRGRTVRISYHLVPEKSWDGEIESIEFRSEP